VHYVQWRGKAVRYGEETRRLIGSGRPFRADAWAKARWGLINP